MQWLLHEPVEVTVFWLEWMKMLETYILEKEARGVLSLAKKRCGGGRFVLHWIPFLNLYLEGSCTIMALLCKFIVGLVVLGRCHYVHCDDVIWLFIRKIVSFFYHASLVVVNNLPCQCPADTVNLVYGSPNPGFMQTNLF